MNLERYPHWDLLDQLHRDQPLQEEQERLIEELLAQQPEQVCAEVWVKYLRGAKERARSLPRALAHECKEQIHKRGLLYDVAQAHLHQPGSEFHKQRANLDAIHQALQLSGSWETWLGQRELKGDPLPAPLEDDELRGLLLRVVGVWSENLSGPEPYDPRRARDSADDALTGSALSPEELHSSREHLRLIPAFSHFVAQNRHIHRLFIQSLFEDQPGAIAALSEEIAYTPEMIRAWRRGHIENIGFLYNVHSECFVPTAMRHDPGQLRGQVRRLPQRTGQSEHSRRQMVLDGFWLEGEPLGILQTRSGAGQFGRLSKAWRGSMRDLSRDRTPLASDLVLYWDRHVLAAHLDDQTPRPPGQRHPQEETAMTSPSDEDLSFSFRQLRSLRDHDIEEISQESGQDPDALTEQIFSTLRTLSRSREAQQAWREYVQASVSEEPAVDWSVVLQELYARAGAWLSHQKQAVEAALGQLQQRDIFAHSSEETPPCIAGFFDHTGAEPYLEETSEGQVWVCTITTSSELAQLRVWRPTAGLVEAFTLSEADAPTRWPEDSGPIEVPSQQHTPLYEDAFVPGTYKFLVVFHPAEAPSWSPTQPEHWAQLKEGELPHLLLKLYVQP